MNEIKQGTPEWFKLRLGKFGSTDAQAVASNGAGLTTAIYKKVAEIKSGVFEDDYINPDMERGNEQEDTARSSYEMETGNRVKQVGYIELDGYIGGSPDGFIDDDGLIEIKCQKNSKYIKTLHTKKIESKYIAQMNHLMYISNRKFCDFVVFNENFADLIIIRIDRDEKFIDRLKVGLKNGTEQIKEILKKLK